MALAVATQTSLREVTKCSGSAMPRAVAIRAAAAALEFAGCQVEERQGQPGDEQIEEAPLGDPGAEDAQPGAGRDPVGREVQPGGCVALWRKQHKTVGEVELPQRVGDMLRFVDQIHLRHPARVFRDEQQLHAKQQQ